MWIRLRDGRGWKLEWMLITEPQLVELRAAVAKAFKAYCEAHEDARVGFVPLTFAQTVITDFDLPLSGLDRMLVGYASYQRVQVADGTWDDGPTGRWRTYKEIYQGEIDE